jgi:methyl-accepting chemotaxis protein
VEAARAGEHGKGFAVVAEEVGNLARMSGSAAKEISALLENSTQRVDGIVRESKAKVGALVSAGQVKVGEGTVVAKRCGNILEEIVNGISSVTQMSGEIATASQEQSRGVTEITKAMAQLDQTTQQNAAASEECASAAEELSAQAVSLRAAVATLVATINGGETAATVSVGPAATVHVLRPKRIAAPGPAAQKLAAGDIPRSDDAGFQEV